MGSIFGGGSETVNTSSKLSPSMQRYVDYAQNKAKEVAGQQYSANRLGIAGVDPNSGAANDIYKQAGGGLGIGMDAMQRGLGMQWNADSAQQYMNPYQSQVMDQWNQQFGDMRQATMNDINNQATQSGAFGGSRHGVAEGQALGDLGKQQSLQQAQMLQSGFGDAYNQFSNERNAAMQGGQGMANLGFGGAQGMMGYGQQQQQVAQARFNAQHEDELRRQGWSQQQLDALNRTMSVSPYSQSGSQTTKTPGNLFGDILGAGLGVASFL